VNEANECRCGRPTSGATLCDQCGVTLEVAAANISAYYADLDAVRIKATRYGGTHATKGGIGKAQPLVLDGRFTDPTGDGSRLAWETRNTVTTWARIMLDQWPPLTWHGPVCPTCWHASCTEHRRRQHPRDNVWSVCAYFQRMLGSIRSAEWADEMLDELLDLERRLRRFVDRPADRWYAGKCSAETTQHNSLTCACACHHGHGQPCDMIGGCGLTFAGALCPVDLYAEAEKGTITCRGCGTVHDVQGRREFLLREAREVHVTATEAAGALLAWTDYDGSESKLVDLIRKWRDRDKLDVADVTSLLGRDRHLYRLGDIQDLLVQHAQREQEKRMSRSA
jgi:hypothetical protein